MSKFIRYIIIFWFLFLVVDVFAPRFLDTIPLLVRAVFYFLVLLAVYFQSKRTSIFGKLTLCFVGVVVLLMGSSLVYTEINSNRLSYSWKGTYDVKDAFNIDVDSISSQELVYNRGELLECRNAYKDSCLYITCLGKAGAVKLESFITINRGVPTTWTSPSLFPSFTMADYPNFINSPVVTFYDVQKVPSMSPIKSIQLYTDEQITEFTTGADKIKIKLKMRDEGSVCLTLNDNPNTAATYIVISIDDELIDFDLDFYILDDMLYSAIYTKALCR